MRTFVTDGRTDIKSRRCSHEMDLKILTGEGGRIGERNIAIG